MNPQGNDYFGAEAVASFNGFPVLRNVIQKYDAKDAKHTLTAAFLGYRAKEDITALPPNFLVQPSQNVLHLASGLIYSRPGYTLDGQAATTTNIIDGIQSSYDWISYVGAEKHLRGHQNSLEYRYVSPTGQVSWLPLMNQNTMSKWDGNGFFRYAEYWNTTESLQELLFVNGDGNIYNWNGAQAAFANATSAALSMNPFLAETPPGEIICITGPAGSTITGTSSNAANYVLTGTLTTPSGLVNVPVALIIITTQPTAGDTLTLTTGNGTVTMTFVSCPYEPPWKFGYGSGSISIGYNYTQIGGPAIYVDVPNLSSPSITQTRNNLLQFLINPGLQQAAFYVGNSTYANVLAPLTINANPVITGSTTTAGNVISFPPDGGTLTFAMVNNPTNGDTATLTIQGQPVQFQFVSVIGTTPGNVLIAGTPALTLANLEALITTPGTTTANGVALSTENQYIISLFQGVVSTGITLQGQQSWLDLGFYSLTTGRSVVINGATFTYTGGETTQTITGVTPDPTTSITINYGDPIVQAPMYTPWTSVTDYAAGFLPDLIAVTGNQVFYGDSTRRDFYISVTNDRNNLTVNSPRLPGDGGQLIADSPVTAFIVQETVMYVGCSPDWWYTVVFGPQQNQSVTISGTTVVTTYEPLVLQTLKTSPGQGPQSQEGVFKVKNSAFVITNEPAIDDFTRIQNDLEMPEAQTLTDSIKNDFLQYNLTGAYGLYIKYFLYVVLPVENKMLVYNFFQAWWEPPQVFPFSRLSIIDGKLYAHSAYVAETYRVFIDNPLDPETVYDDNGQPINCIAAFSYNNFGTRDIKKQFTELFVEGYISSNTTLTCASKFDFGGYSGMQTFSLSGALASNLVYTYADNSIGKVPLGKNPIGSITDSLSNLPKFRHIFTGINIDFFEYQPYFQTNDVDQQWQLLAVAVNQQPSDSGVNEIKT